LFALVETPALLEPHADSVTAAAAAGMTNFMLGRI
jgi:hypothetical protein